MYLNDDCYAVRIYVAPNSDTRMTQWDLRRPLIVTGDRCLAFRTATEGEDALRKIINETWDAPGIWRLLTAHEKTLVSSSRPELARHPEEISSWNWLSKEVRPSCVCVAVRHERSNPRGPTHLERFDDPWSLSLYYQEKALVWTREFRVFVGDHGQGPNGPLFKDLAPVSEHALLEEGVLALAALSNLG